VINQVAGLMIRKSGLFATCNPPFFTILTFV